MNKFLGWFGGLPLWLKLLLVLGLPLLLVGLAVDLLRPPKTVTETEISERIRQAELNVQRQYDEKWQAEQSRRQDWETRVLESARFQAQQNTDSRSTTYRGDLQSVAALLATQRPGAAPVVVNMPPATPAPVGGSGEPSLVPVGEAPKVEVIIKDERIMATASGEKNVDMAASGSNTEMGSAVGGKTGSETLIAKEVEKDRNEKIKKTETGGGDEDGGRFGIGVTAKGQPLATLDVKQISLGPKSFGLGKVGAGLFITRGSDNGIDGGPQINWSKKRLGIVGGYAVKAKEPTIGLIYKF